ncbi:MAG: hypothetical protein IJO52_03460 [Clostridia bacterium]|nr:hypothetical protein [Clostridia bacterium]
MKRILAIVLLTALVLTMVSCRGKDTEVNDPETSDTAVDTKDKESEVLTLEKIIADVEASGEFQTLIYDKAMSMSQASKDFNGEIGVAFTVLLQQPTESEAWVCIYGLENESDAKTVEEGRSYLVQSRFGDDGYCRRFGSMVLYGNLKIIDELDYSGYTYPESCEPINEAEPSFEDVQGVVATIESKDHYGATYYSDNLLASVKDNLGCEGELLGFAQVTEMSGKSEWLQVVEFELDSDAAAFIDEMSAKLGEYENGGYFRSGNIVVMGDSPLIAEFESGVPAEREALSIGIIVDTIKSSSNLAPQYYDKAARTKHEADFVPRITLHEVVEFYTAEDKFIYIYRAENEDDAIIAEEGRMWLVDDRYGAEGSCVRYGTIVIYGNMNLISTLDFSSYGLPEETEPKAYELEPSLDSVKGIVATLESSAPLGARYFDERYPALMKNRYQISGEITDMAHLSSAGSSADWIYVYEFSLESDAIAFESARADEVAGYANGGCIRIGNIVVYGDSEFISILK